MHCACAVRCMFVCVCVCLCVFVCARARALMSCTAVTHRCVQYMQRVSVQSQWQSQCRKRTRILAVLIAVARCTGARTTLRHLNPKRVWATQITRLAIGQPRKCVRCLLAAPQKVGPSTTHHSRRLGSQWCAIVKTQHDEFVARLPRVVFEVPQDLHRVKLR